MFYKHHSSYLFILPHQISFLPYKWRFDAAFSQSRYFCDGLIVEILGILTIESFAL